MSVEIWHNPKCTKSRQAKAALEEAGVEFHERRYLDDSPTAAELRATVDRLGGEPWDIARAKEAKEAGIDLPKDVEHREEWLIALAANPRALQRPILTATDGTTVVGRDEDSLARLIEAETSLEDAVDYDEPN